MISIVIPALNEEKLIGECLDSLKKQDYTGSYEIVVVDNGSTDHTPDVARNMGVRVVFCGQKGVAYARQEGMLAAQGDIVIQADADTIYPGWWINRIKKQFDNHPKSVAIAGTFIYKDPPWWCSFEYFLRSFFGLFTSLVFRRALVISGANFAFRKKALIQAGGYRQNVYSSDQIDIASRLSKIGKVYYDWRSYAYTSNRSVRKHPLRLMFEFMRNLTYFALHMLQKIFPKMKKGSPGTSSLTTGT
jgi:glycosyltransferase involved in cell wall biosynthesis